MAKQIVRTVCIAFDGDTFKKSVEVDSSFSQAQIESLIHKELPFVAHVKILSRGVNHGAH